MVYQNKLVAVIKVDGKVLRETSGTVTIPFGSEYSVLLKNLNSVRVMAKVSIDGTDATDGTWLVLQPYGSLELERFIKNGNLSSGNRFKFIERTKQIEDFKGIGVEDGIVRVEYKPEKKKVEVPVVNYKYYDQWIGRPYWPRPYWSTPYYCGDFPYSGYISGQVSSTWGDGQSQNFGGTFTNTSGSSKGSGNFIGGMAVNCSSTPTRGLMKSASVPGLDSAKRSVINNAVAGLEAERNDAGITVPGSQSNQQFSTVSSFDTEASDVLVLFLRGTSDGVPVKLPLTVSRKLHCTTCGKQSKSSATFCSGCGTALEVI